MIRKIAVLLTLWSACVFSQPADLDQWVERTRKEFEVPGIAIGIVKDGKTVYAKGFGVRKLGTPGAVDDRTVFGVASNTKAFTAAALALLVDQGKIAWDDPVQKHIPWFQMYDPWVGRELTVRDTLSHRSGLGLGAGDLLFWPDTDVSRAEVVAAARFIKPASSIRSRYAYNNLMFVVAGEIVAAVSGKSYDEFVTEQILKPLEMTESRIGFRDGPNVAMPHSRGWRLEGTLAPIQPTRDHTWAAAAGLKTNVRDLLKWLNGHLEGKRPWKDGTARDMWQAQTALPLGEPPAAMKAARTNFAAYGLGWSLREYKGRKTVSHGGALTGMFSTTYMVPDEKLGIVVLTNQEEGGAMSSIVNHVLDHYLGGAETDWISVYRKQRTDTITRAKEAEAKLEAGRAKDSKPSLALSAYAGEYRDDWYGKIVVVEEAGRLVMRFTRTPAMVADLSHWQQDSFRAVFRDHTIPDAFITFSLTTEGKVETARMKAVSSLADFSFDFHDLLLKPVAKDR